MSDGLVEKDMWMVATRKKNEPPEVVQLYDTEAEAQAHQRLSSTQLVVVECRVWFAPVEDSNLQVPLPL